MGVLHSNTKSGVQISTPPQIKKMGVVDKRAAIVVGFELVWNR